MSDKPLIAPERLGIWVVVTFILTILALGLSVVSLQRNSVTFGVTQVEFLTLNKKVADLEKQQSTPSVAKEQTTSAPAPETKK